MVYGVSLLNSPASVPTAMGTRPPLRADPAPEDDPPGKYDLLYQFVAVPVEGFKLLALCEISWTAEILTLQPVVSINQPQPVSTKSHSGGEKNTHPCQPHAGSSCPS